MARTGDAIRKRTITRTHADGSVYRFEKWVGSVDLGTDPVTGKRVRQDFSADTLTEAGRLKRKLLQERDRGRRANSAAGWTVGTWSDHWVETVVKTDKHEGTYLSYRRDVTNSIIPSPIGKRLLGKLEPPEVNNWKAWLQETRHLAPSTRRRCLTVLRKALQSAVRQGLIGRNPSSKEYVDGISVPKRPVRALSQRQLHSLLDQARCEQDPNYAMYALCAATGLRQGEVLGLRWADTETEPGLDLARGVVRVREQLVRYNGPGRIESRVKRGSIRDLALDPTMVTVLHQHRVRLLERQLQAGSTWTEHGLVFPTRVGTPQRAANAWLSFKRLLKRAGLPTDFTFHNQRSTAASLAIADGAAIFNVSRMLGHSDLRTTANQYGHLFPEGRQEMAERMGRIVLGELPQAASEG
jgi:integrase